MSSKVQFIEEEVSPTAFPSANIMSRNRGMTLRDWFAGMAIGQSMIERPGEATDVSASIAYAMADSMMKEREKNES